MNKRVVQSFLVIILLLFWVSPLIAQDFDSKGFVVTQFGMDEGLPQSSVNDIVQDKDGYLWIATFGGLVRFDGYTFTTFNRSNTKGMNFDRSVILFEDSKGNIWAGTEQGIVKFDGHKMVSYPIDINASSFIPRDFKEDNAGRIWVSLNGSPYLFNNDRFELKTTIELEKYNIDEIVKDASGVWLFLERALVKSLGDSLYKILDLRDDIETSIIDFIEYPVNSGDYFIGTSGDGILKFNGEKISLLDEEKSASSRDIRNFYIDNKNRLWLNSYQGTAIWNGSRFISFSEIESEQNIDIQISTMLEDNEGNLWLGSGANGLFRLTTSNINMIDYNDGLFNQNMLSLTSLNDGSYLFGTNCGGVYTYKNNTTEASVINKYLPNPCIWAVFQDSKGRIWFSSDGLYMTESLEENGIVFDEDEGFEGENVFAITEDLNGNIWIGCSNGVFSYNDSGFKKYSTPQGVNIPEVRTFFEDKEGTIWVGTISGIFKIKNEGIEQVILSENHEIAENTDQPFVRAIHEDEEGVIWIGSYGNGLFRILNDDVRNITTTDGLFDNVISHIIEDEQGNFWMGSNRGVSKVSRQQLNNFINGEVDQVQAYAYGTAEGMNSAETNGGFQPDVISDSEGNIYFPTVAGVAIVSTKDISRNGIAPPVYIEGARTNEGGLSVSESISLPYDVDFLEIDYTAVSFTESENVQFRYRLEGLNEEWIDVGNNREALFVKIPPGNYTFTVIASNNDGVWNMEGASLEVNIIPPFWMTSWFYTILILLFLSSGFALFYVRTRRLKRENERQKRFSEQLIESQEQERRRIASELHDGLGQQILVIKNRVELAEQSLEDSTSIAEQLKEIKHSAISSISDVRNISHGLRPILLEKFGLREALINLCEEIKNTSALEWSYHVDEVDNTLPRDKEINFFRVIQEGANNIIRHSEAEEAAVMIVKQNGNLKATLWDDGKGMSKEEIASFKGLGFVGMKERIDSFGGSLIIDSAPGDGTTIKIEIPITDHE